MSQESHENNTSTDSAHATSHKAFKGIKHFIGELLLDLVGQSWALLGLTVAWLVLEGSAKKLTGILILVVVAIWMITFPFRHHRKI
jgi:uncharacterized membrane protein